MTGKTILSSAVSSRSCVVLMLLSMTAFAQNREMPPNILLIISDDIGLDATTNMYPGMIERLVEHYGPSGLDHPDYEMIEGRPASTPVLDDLAREGMSFTQAWVQPFCSPTRASILTGLFAAKTHVLDYYDYLTQSHRSFVNDLRNAGYSTAAFGKWHMAGLGQYPGMKPKEAGFDLFLGNLHGGLATYWEYDYHVQDEATPPDQWRTEQPPARSLQGIEATTYAPVVKVADAIEWITAQEASHPDKPWFAWLAFNVAHITAQQEPNPMAVPNADTMTRAAIGEMTGCGGEFGSANVGSCSSEALMRAMTNSMDTVIGKVLEVIDSLDSNTYIVYVGDNGSWMFGERREFIDNLYLTKQGRGKGTAYESGVRVPLTIRGPGIARGSLSDEPVHGVDLFATILALAALDVPEMVPTSNGDAEVPLDSLSLTPILLGDADKLRDADYDYLLAETVNPVMDNLRHAGARTGHYKLVCAERASPENCEFFDLDRDPLEEYALDGPRSCNNYTSGRWSPANQEWHFCRLLEVIDNHSFLSANWERGSSTRPTLRDNAQ